jgi:hypothetical protein
MGSVASVNPLSAQAQLPSRRSGADKEQEPAEIEGSAGQGLVGPPVGRADIASRRHRLRPKRMALAPSPLSFDHS